MAKAAPDLVVREHERHICDVRAVFTLAPASAGAVRLAPSVTRGGGAVEARIVDFSRGGLGLASHVYLPPSCAVIVTLVGDDRVGPVLARVRRVTMTDRKPTYYLGLGFEQNPSGLAVAARLIEVLRAPDGVVPPEASLA